MPKIECIQDVVMKQDGVVAFTKGKVYNLYAYNQQEDWDKYTQVLCAKNDQKKRHIIKHKNETKLDEFFNNHFRLLPNPKKQGV